MSEQVMPQGGGADNKKSCCFYGCIGLVVVGILLVAVVGIGGYIIMKKVGDVVVEVTEAEPVELPVTELAPDEKAALDAKLENINQALEGQSDTKTFQLTADELNGLLDSRDDMPFGDWVELSIADGAVKGQVSIPLDETPVGFLAKGRYFNGTGTFDVSIQDGTLRIFLVDAEMKGKEFPQEALQQLKGQNLAQNITDPQVTEVFQKVQDLRVEGDHIVLELK